MSLDNCKVLDLPKIQDARGNLTFIEAGRHVPFDFKRAYFLYDVPGGSTRGGHAHKNLHQIIIAMSGSFDIELSDGVTKKRFHLNRSYFGLYIPPMVWREMDNFSSGSVALVLASEFFSEEDYFRDFSDYVASRGMAC
jgi:dTDP-4-dehydrorhamnose 3,5-epimerase-like enzyme